MRGRLQDTPVPAEGETFQQLAKFGDTWIEQIVSSATPDLAPYDQAQDEWVLLLEGEASLEVAGEVMALRAGDHVLLPAHTPHRLLSASQGARWLAVHCLRR